MVCRSEAASLLCRGLSRWLRHVLWRSLNVWIVQTATTRAEQEQLDASTSLIMFEERLSHSSQMHATKLMWHTARRFWERVLGMGFRRWVDHADTAVDRSERLRGLVLRRHHVSLSESFSGWVLHVRRVGVLSRTIRHMLNVSLGRCFARWRLLCVELYDLHGKLLTGRQELEQSKARSNAEGRINRRRRCPTDNTNI